MFARTFQVFCLSVRGIGSANRTDSVPALINTAYPPSLTFLELALEAALC